MAVSLAISKIISVKEWPNLKIWVWGCSRSLKMVLKQYSITHLNFRLCYRILFYYLNYQPNERFQVSLKMVWSIDHV